MVKGHQSITTARVHHNSYIYQATSVACAGRQTHKLLKTVPAMPASLACTHALIQHHTRNYRGAEASISASWAAVKKVHVYLHLSLRRPWDRFTTVDLSVRSILEGAFLRLLPWELSGTLFRRLSVIVKMRCGLCLKSDTSAVSVSLLNFWQCGMTTRPRDQCSQRQ